MQGWKRAVIFGSLGAGALLIIGGRKAPGMVVAAAGLAVLASEYPEAFETIWQDAPVYIDRGVRIFSALSAIGERVAEEAARGSSRAWHEMVME
ncbi:MAG: hypothetical protein ACM3PW_01990 [Chlamydiota bacterium]